MGKKLSDGHSERSEESLFTEKPRKERFIAQRRAMGGGPHFADFVRNDVFGDFSANC
jgi:hypothetical protein